MRGGGAGSVAGGIGLVPLIGIGAATLRNQRVMMVPMSDDDVDQAGMIGFETYERFVTRIDYGHHTIELIEPSAFDPAEAGTAIPISFYGNLPTVQASYGGKSGSFIIDTGIATSVFLTAPFVARNGIRPPAGGGVRIIAGVGVGGPSYGSVFRGKPFRLGDLTIERPVTILSSDTAGAMADPALAGIIGSGVLERFVVTLDYAHARMYLRPIQPVPLNLDQYDRSGMRIARAAQGFRVTEVVERGPAAAAGLEKGDILISIEGRPAGKLTIDEVRALLRTRAPGTSVPIIIRDQGKTKEAVLVLGDLL